MNTTLIIFAIVTLFIIYRIIASSRKQEGYKRWKATGSETGDAKETKANKRENKRVRNLSDGGGSIYRSKKRRGYNPEAMKWCADFLQVELRELNRIIPHTKLFYHEMWLRKRKGGFRNISMPLPVLKRIQQKIYTQILMPVAIHPAATGFRPKYSIADNVKPHLGSRYVLKTDLHDFFPLIRRRMVVKAFKKIGYPRPIAVILADLCCRNSRLPQGAPTSPALSNIISYNMDKKLEILAAKHNLIYTRYADDITLSGDELDKDELLPQIVDIIDEQRFEMNRNKTRLMGDKDRKIITGVSISSGVKMTIPKAKKREIRKNVYFVLTKGVADHQRRIGSTDPVYVKRLIGRLCYWRSIEPDNAYVLKSIESLKQIR